MKKKILAMLLTAVMTLAMAAYVVPAEEEAADDGTYYMITLRTDRSHLGTDEKPLIIIPGMVAPYNIILVKTYVESIPASLEESATIDGASSVQVFQHVTIPLLIPSITTAVVINLIGGFKMYDVIVALTSGGPSRGSLSLSYYIQLLYFQDEKAGYASAVGVLMFFMILILTVPINAWLRKREVEA